MQTGLKSYLTKRTPEGLDELGILSPVSQHHNRDLAVASDLVSHQSSAAILRRCRDMPAPPPLDYSTPMQKPKLGHPEKLHGTMFYEIAPFMCGCTEDFRIISLSNFLFDHGNQ